MQRNLERSESRWRDVALWALDVLLDQWRRGFDEVRHVMVFPRRLGFIARNSTHVGDLFQRALIADVLAEADRVLSCGLQVQIDSEIGYVLESRQRDRIGGWSYFPDLRELPPDADDLAQVMQLLLRRRREHEI